jgi:hypothetical protein
MPTPLTLELDVQCLHCGYNLRTLALDALCPECGQPVLHSLARRPFGPINRRTLRRVALGLLLAPLTSLLAAILIFLVADSTPWPAMVALFPGGDKAWLLLIVFSQSPFIPIYLTALAFLSIALHFLSVWLVTATGPMLPGVSARRAAYRSLAILSFIIAAVVWYTPSAAFSFVGLIFAVLCDLGQMIFFMNWAASLAQAAPYHDLAISLARARDLLLGASALIGMGFCGACTFTPQARSLQFVMALICLIPATLAAVAVIRLASRIYQIQPLLAE